MDRIAESDTTPRWALVLNDKAGAFLAAKDSANTLQQRLATAGMRVHVVPDEADLPGRVALAHQKGAEAVIVAGGDGTIACAAQILAGTGTALGILPCGTMNLLAKDLRLPLDDHLAAIDVLRAGTRRRIDVAEVEGHVFTCACMLGTPARIGRHREAARQRGGGLLSRLRIVLAALRTALRDRARHYTLRIDGKTARVRTASLTVTVGELDDATGRLFGRMRLDSGMFTIYILEPSGPLALLRFGARLLRGKPASDPALKVLRARELQVHRSRAALRLLVDGEERLLPPPLRFRLRPHALTVLAP